MSYWVGKCKPQIYPKGASKSVRVWSILVILFLVMIGIPPTAEGMSGSPIIPSTDSTALTTSSTAASIPAGINPPSTPLICPGQQNTGPEDLVGKNGSTFVYHGAPIKFYGSAFYPETVGGASAWHEPDFTQYLDHIMLMGFQLGQNLFRPTDYWDQSNPHPEIGSNYVWQNLDYLVCKAQSHHVFVEMDLSAFQKVLISQHLDPFNASNWITFLLAAGQHYKNQSSIAFYSLVGEPNPPVAIDAFNKLLSFYQATTDILRAADPHHLITAGGFIHMEEETLALPWWHAIYALPNNDIVTFKTYSLNDLHLIPIIAAVAKQINKPAFDEEFGMPQSFGDANFAGGPGFNGIQTGRAQFYQDVYSAGQSAGVPAFAFWDLGCSRRSSSYQVNPTTPATWAVIRQHAPAPNEINPSIKDQSLCP